VLTCEQQDTPKSNNIFDEMPALMPDPKTVADELSLYLSTGPEPVKDVLPWWYEKRTVYPMLSRMALDYLSIPGVL
jgi:hypothetical protein